MPKNRLILLRHGESKWNLENRFTGWTNVELTSKGYSEAKNAGKLLSKFNFEIDLVYTSVLKRANDTMDICLNVMNLSKIKKIYDWRLNERHYGALQGLNKSETILRYGKEKVMDWRRSFEIQPPRLSVNDSRHPRFESLYKDIDDRKLPSSESLKDTIKRFLPLWDNYILPSIKSGRKIMIVAHGNSLRALVKMLDNVSNNDIINLNIPTGSPLIYEFDSGVNVLNSYYLSDEKSEKNGIS